MKASKYIFSGIIIVGVVFGILVYSPAKSDAQTPGDKIVTAYSVSTITAAKKSVSNSFSLVGTIIANNDVTVLSETQGRVVKVMVEVGDYKPAGSVLVEVDSELKEAAYKTAKMTYEKAKKDLERFESLYKDQSISESQIEQARWNFQSAETQYIVARRQFTDTKITTPISGIVTARYVNVGSTVMGMPQPTAIVNIIDISKLKVKVSVAEKDVFRLKIGEKVIVTTDIYPNTVFEGKISSISSKGDDAHTYPVEVTLQNNPNHPLKAGMFGLLTFSAHSASSALWIPREAIMGSLKDAKIFVIENNLAKSRKVSVGSENGTDVEILNGLKEGEVVVVNGQVNLKENSAVIVRK